MLAEFLGVADAYHNMGIAIVPFVIGADGKKRPDISTWAKWQTTKQTDEEFKNLHLERYEMFGLVCGTPLTLNGETVYLVGIDRDIKDDNLPEQTKQKSLLTLNLMPVTKREKTRSGGNHLIYFSRKQVSGHKPANTGMELLGIGNLMVTYASEGYKLENNNGITIVNDAEATFFEALEKADLYCKEKPTKQTLTPKQQTSKKTPRPCMVEALKQQLTGGNGHNMRLAIATEYRRLGYNNQQIVELFRNQTDFDYDKCLRQIESVKPELSASCNSIKEYGFCLPACKIKSESHADKAVNLCLAEDVILFHDQYKKPYARIPNTKKDDADDKNDSLTFKTNPDRTYYSITPLRSETFKAYVSHLMYEENGKVIGNEALNSALNVLHYKALAGKQITLHNRVAPDPSGDGSIWLDMADQYNQDYHVAKDGWEKVSSLLSPIMFRRYDHQEALPVAVKGGDPWRLLDYLSIRKPLVLKDKTASLSSSASFSEKQKEEKNQLLKRKRLFLMTQMASYLIPEIAHPIIAFFGGHGTYKSCSQVFIRRVFDPSIVPKFGVPRNSDDLIQQLEHHYMPIYDNVSTVGKWFSDTLCRAITGEGQELRKLYTDDDSFIREFRRCPMINGINMPAQEGDLLDRIAPYETEPENSRRTEAELNASFEKDLPEILGGFLDAVVSALNLKETNKAPKLFRLADFTEWGCVLAKALGGTQEDFIQGYEDIVNFQNDETIHANPVVTAFVAFCQKDVTERIEDSPTNIYDRVTIQAELLKINPKSRRYPKTPQLFTRELNKCKSAINSTGFDFEVIKGVNRVFAVWKLDEKPYCYFCGQIIYENTWIGDGFTENKPAHKKCYDDLRAQLKEDG